MTNIFSIEEIQDAVDNANKYLLEAYPQYIEPDFIQVKYTKATSYWANIRTLPKELFDNSVGKKAYLIKIGSMFSKISDPKLRLHRFQECIIHELIHTIDGCMNHKTKFKAIAAKVCRRHPQFNIHTSTAAEDFGVIFEPVKYNYEIRCMNCGKVYNYLRKPRYQISKYQCTCCKSCSLSMKKIK